MPPVNHLYIICTFFNFFYISVSCGCYNFVLIPKLRESNLGGVGDRLYPSHGGLGTETSERAEPALSWSLESHRGFLNLEKLNRYHLERIERRVGHFFFCCYTVSILHQW